jgi:transposase InsO family protein
VCVAGQGTAFVKHLQSIPQGAANTILFRDRDNRFAADFDSKLKTAGIEMRRTPIRSPNMNAFVERWIQSVRVECLDKLIALGETHLSYLVPEYVAYFQIERPHQSLGNWPLPEADSPDPPVLPFPERAECKKYLGGVLKHYRRAA